jgi:hypothetical protein
LIYDLSPGLSKLISDWKFLVIFVNACMVAIFLMVRNSASSIRSF